MKEKIAKWYAMGLWKDSMVLDAANKGIITPAEANEILKL